MAKRYWLLNPPGTKRKKRARKNPALAIYGNHSGGAMARRRNSKGRFIKGGGGGGRKTKARRKTYRRKQSHARASYLRRARRNPSVRSVGKGLMGLIPPPKRIACGMAGALATRIIPAQAAKFFPQIPLSDTAGLVVKAVAAGFAARFVIGKACADDLVFGGLITVGDEAARLHLYPNIGMPVGAYLDPALAAYIDEGGMGYSPAALPDGSMIYEDEFSPELAAA